MNKEQLKEKVKETVLDEIRRQLGGENSVNESALFIGSMLALGAGAGWFANFYKNTQKLLHEISQNEAIQGQFNKSLPQFNTKFDRLIRLFKMAKSLENVIALEKESEKMIGELERARRDSKKIKVTHEDYLAGANSRVVQWMFRNREIDETQATRAAQVGFERLIDELISQLRDGLDAAMNQAEQATGA